MTHYEERLEKDLVLIHDRVAEMAAMVEEALKNAIHALVTGNTKLAYATVLGDLPINRHMRKTEKLCNAFLATHLPPAGPLRQISSIFRTIISLERLGDYAVTICREAVQLSGPPKGPVVREVELLADESFGVLKQATSAFNESNADAARAIKATAARVERTFDMVYSRLVESGQEQSIKDLFGMFVILSLLTRVADQTKNICEDVLYAVAGETKAPKVYNIMFLDEDNSCQSQMAEAIARKLFPNFGQYTSAGRKPAETMDAHIVRFLESHGLDVSSVRPKALEMVHEELADYHVIVSLQGNIKTYIDEMPFHTVALEWDVGSAPTGLDEEQTNQRLEEMYRDTALQVRDFMEILRGEEATS